MKLLTQLRIRYRVVTPAFLGGADLSSAELRSPSIKAALRFWYRAVDPEFSKRDTPDAPIRESLLFGATERGAGQSKVLLTVTDEQLKYLKSRAIPWTQFDDKRDRYPKNGLAYLGYSLRLSGNGVRTALAPESTFTLRFLLRPGGGDICDREARGLISAAWLLGHLGGLGSRSRRGFGGLALEEWRAEGPGQKLLESAMARLAIGPKLQYLAAWNRTWSQARDVFRQWFGAFPDQPGRRLENPNLGPRTRAVVGSIQFRAGEWPKAMNAAGRKLQDFRARRPPDYSLVKEHLLHEAQRPGGKALRAAPPRVSFGLPLAFRYSSLPNQSVTLVPYIGDRQCERMGSLLFVRILALGDGLHPAFFRLDGAVPGFDVPAGQRAKDRRPLGTPVSCALDDFMDRLE